MQGEEAQTRAVDEPTPRSGRDGHAARASERQQLLRWVAGLGAVTAEALAYSRDISEAAARGRLQALVDEGVMRAARPLRERPTLYAVTLASMLVGTRRALDPCRITPVTAPHLIACAAVAAGLERGFPRHLLRGERDLRLEEREHGALLASAALASDRGGPPRLHRPDFVLWPRQATRGEALPIAVEVELTVKGRGQLSAICDVWARCRLVAGVLYLVTPEVERALQRALARTHAGGRVVAVPLRCLPGPIARFVPSDA
jgi:hypothetical protein